MKVELLQTLTSKVTSKIKANKFIPLTQFVGVKTRDGKLMLCATDGSNHICSRVDTDMEPGVDISISTDLFSKLVNALPPQMDVMLSFENNTLVIHNDSINYHVPAISDDSGLIKYPEIQIPVVSTEFDLKKFTEHYNRVQNSVDAQSLIPYLAAIYVSDSMLGTNDHLLAKSNCGDLFGQPVLLPLPLCEVLMQLNGDKVSSYISDGYLTMFDSSTIIRGKLHDGLNEYPVNGIKNLFNMSFDSYVAVNVSNFASALDRISLFISDFDDNIMKMIISENKLSISSVNKSGYEEVVFDSKEGNVPNITAFVDVTLLGRLLKSFTTPLVNLYVNDGQIVAHAGDTEVICATAQKGE